MGGYYYNGSSRSGIGRHGLDYLAQNRDMWWALVNAVIKFWFPINREIS